MSQSRGHEMPMDFEFQNKTGPLDLRSPFAQVGQNVQRFPPRQTPSKKRAPNSFGTPSFHSSPNKPLPSVPAFNALYNTPRKMNNDFDDSSAGETPQSRAADSDATPDHVGYRGAMSKFDNLSLPAPAPAKQEKPNSGSPGKNIERPAPSTSNSASTSNQNSKSSSSPKRKEGFLAKMKSKLYSPGQGDILRANHSQAIEKRVRKYRKREIQRSVARRRRLSMSDSGDDSERILRGLAVGSPRKTSRGQQQQREDDSDGFEADSPRASSLLSTFTSSIQSLFTFIGQHPTIPHILAFYAQLCFNVFLLAGCAWVIYSFWAAVRGDIDMKSHEYMADVVVKMAKCAKDYRENGCDSETPPPVLAAACAEWFQCANRDPRRVALAKVSMHTFSEIFVSFVEPLTYKAMIFTSLLVFGSFAISNLAFGALSRGSHHQQQQQYYAPPPTPQRNFSGQEGTPWQGQSFPSFEPNGGGYGQIEGRGSPVRRLAYN